ncbi:MAG: hypothetical protein VX069_08990 [Cyanobacteriota bacterium]|nr:hypothetical protein [Cyanobacteriota bacterium]
MVPQPAWLIVSTLAIKMMIKALSTNPVIHDARMPIKRIRSRLNREATRN